MATTRRQFIELSATLGAAVALGGRAALAATAPRVSRTRLLLGGAVRVTVQGEESAAASACDAALDAVAAIESELSLYLPSSALSRLNRDRRIDDAPESLRTCLGHALEIAEASDGAFDPSVEPALAVIRTSFRDRGAPPSDTELRAALSRVGWSRVRMAGRTVTLPEGGAITLNGVAKGYAMDRARAALARAGATRVLCAASGDMAVGPARWNVELQDPLHPDRVLQGAGFHPVPGGLGASGGYMNHFTQDLTWHHIVDPRTGRSPRHFAGTVASAPTAMEADALSTATLVLPEEAALALVESRGAALLAIRSDGTSVRSRGAIRSGL